MTKYLAVAFMVAAMLALSAMPALALDNDDFFILGDEDGGQEAESGDVSQSFDVSGTGDNSNQCVGIQGVANTGNAQNSTALDQDGDGVEDTLDLTDDILFDDDSDLLDFLFGDRDGDGVLDSDASVDVSPTNTTDCSQSVNQAAAAS